ncbi:MAG: hypothetical protein KBC91_06195 [Candidatus Omnitrophica bacterium]|nr:hypothetical protein [Candidatus Omnitrophota bacterium]
MKKFAVLGLVLIMASYGCATARKIKSLPEENLYFSMSASESKKQMLRGEIVNRHPEWSEDTRQLVLKGEIAPGMTSDQVKSSYGKPLEILQTTKGEPANVSLWIYNDEYLTFKDDKLAGSEDVVKIEVKSSLVEKVRYGF